MRPLHQVDLQLPPQRRACCLCIVPLVLTAKQATMCDEPQSPAREYYDHPDWQDGDFTLISSDGWRFRISSEVLFAARYA